MAKWIKESIERPGALRRSMGVKEGEKIPTTTLKDALATLRASAKKKNLSANELRKLRQINPALT